MKIFLDTANLEDIQKTAPLGIINDHNDPSLIAKEGVPVEEQIRRICNIVEGDVSAAVIATGAREMVEEGRRLASIHKNVVVKVPLTRDGITATSALAREGVRINVTLCFSAAQALLAAKAGAYIVSPLVGRVDDLGWPGLKLIEEIVAIYSNSLEPDAPRLPFAALFMSWRWRRPALIYVTLVPKVLDQLFYHPLTEKGLDQFLSEYNRVFELANTR